MICAWTCFIAAMFIIGKVLFTYFMTRHGVVAEYEKSLDQKQQKIYKEIVDHRKMLALQGYALGLVISIGFLLARHKMVKKFNGLCFMVAITFIVQYFYYILMPKHEWMLNHITSQQQKEQWVKVYRAYSWNYHLSILIGLIGAGVLGYGIC